jgi:Kef-type K+ transport system membrane component KefB
LQALIGIAGIWLVSRLLGAVARRFRQPAIIGELLAGIILGPSLLGSYYSFSSPSLDKLNVLGSALFLLTAGWGIRLSDIGEFKRVGLAVSAAGSVIPFLIGYGIGTCWPDIVGYDQSSPGAVFAVFIGIAMSVSALPVIARTLMDMGLYRSRIGIITMSAVTIDDLLGWIGFSLMLSLLGRMGIGAQVNFFLPLVCYVAGVLIGEINNPNGVRVKSHIESMVRNVFAPIVFASVAIKLSFIQNFDLRLAVVLIVIASVGKIFGCTFAALAMEMPRRDAWAIGFAMNSRGAMIIILSSLARQFHVIGDKLLVAVITMAVATSLMSAPLIRLARGTAPAD